MEIKRIFKSCETCERRDVGCMFLTDFQRVTNSNDPKKKENFEELIQFYADRGCPNWTINNEGGDPLTPES